MNLKRPLLISIGLIALSALTGAWAEGQLPDHARVATHFAANGQADGYSPKEVAFFILPAINAAVIAVLAVLPRMSRPKGLEASAGPYGVMLIGICAVMLVSQAAVVAHALDPTTPVLRYVFAAVGVLFVVLGNLLGKVRHNDIIGIRTPWTLASERVWDKTHRFTGRLMFVAGIVLAGAAVFSPNTAVTVGVMIACASVPAISGVVYSRLIYDRAGSGASPPNLKTS